MQWRTYLCVLPVLLASLTQAVASPPQTPQEALEDVARVVEHSFPDVPHLTVEALAKLLSMRRDDVIVLDVRTADEFAVSRIAGAVRIDPSAKSTTAIVDAAGSLEGKIVVAYCSIGLRSARLMVRIGQSIKDRGATNLYNLRGGVFQWRNDQHPLIAVTGTTQRIHPFNVGWRQYLANEP